ncbi:hypothetical protein LCGC14_0174910 [marine sediment metagenome]|uniref:Uncharacterized protein n=1 Tax=marine sediment metagenome TaxID=412755 RepID=A0A0F9V7C5_9ZZZZ
MPKKKPKTINVSYTLLFILSWFLIPSIYAYTVINQIFLAIGITEINKNIYSSVFIVLGIIITAFVFWISNYKSKK